MRSRISQIIDTQSQMLQYILAHFPEIRIDILIGISQNTIAKPLQFLISLSVRCHMFLSFVLHSVNLYDRSGRENIKIHNIVSYIFLAIHGDG